MGERGTGLGARALIGAMWLVVAGVALVVVVGWVDVQPTTTLRFAGLHLLLVAAQAALPQLGLAASLALLVAVVARRRGLAVAAGATALAVLVPVVPVALPGDAASPGVGLGQEDLVVYVHNLRYDNATPAEAVDQALSSGADVLVLVEVTPGLRAQLEERGIAARFPHQRWLPSEDAYGAAIASRRPLGPAPVPEAGARLAASVPVGPGTLDVVAVHTSSPASLSALPGWRRDLGALARHARQLTGPTLLAGDFNATWWHRPFARILEAEVVDAHQAVGRALTPSWPALGLVRPLGPVLGVGPFTRLDHALAHQIEVVEVVDRPSAGSDHRAFEVTVRSSAATR